MMEKTKNIFTYLLLVCFSISFASSPKWYIETVDNTEFVGDSSSIKIDSKGYPHISYNEYNYDGELRYAYFDGNKWNIEIVDNNGNIQLGTSIALDNNDNPHIAYCDLTNKAEGLKYAYFDGTKWNIEKVNINDNTSEREILLDVSDMKDGLYIIGVSDKVYKKLLLLR